jgi:type I restriction enzyme R subunit
LFDGLHRHQQRRPPGRAAQQIATFADASGKPTLGWDSVYAWNQETFGPTAFMAGNLRAGTAAERDAVLVRDLRSALVRLNPQLPPAGH